MSDHDRRVIEQVIMELPSLAGPEDVVADVREWRRRHGGTLYGMWPLAASGLNGLRTRFPRMAATWL